MDQYTVDLLKNDVTKLVNIIKNLKIFSIMKQSLSAILQGVECYSLQINMVDTLDDPNVKDANINIYTESRKKFDEEVKKFINTSTSELSVNADKHYSTFLLYMYIYIYINKELLTVLTGLRPKNATDEFFRIIERTLASQQPPSLKDYMIVQLTDSDKPTSKFNFRTAHYTNYKMAASMFIRVLDGTNLVTSLLNSGAVLNFITSFIINEIYKKNITELYQILIGLYQKINNRDSDVVDISNNLDKIMGLQDNKNTYIIQIIYSACIIVLPHLAPDPPLGTVVKTILQDFPEQIITVSNNTVSIIPILDPSNKDKILKKLEDLKTSVRDSQINKKSISCLISNFIVIVLNCILQKATFYTSGGVNSRKMKSTKQTAVKKPAKKPVKKPVKKPATKQTPIAAAGGSQKRKSKKITTL